MAAITSANLANAIVKLVAVDALPPLVGNLVMGNLINRNFEPTLATAGDVVNVPIPPIMVANNIAEGGAVQTQNSDAGNAQIVLNKHVEASFQIPDVTKVIAVPDLLKLYMEPALNAVAEQIETDILSLYALLTANAAVGGASTVDEARVDAAETALFNAKVPQSQGRSLVVNGGTYGKLRQIGRFSEMLSYGNGTPISTGQVLQVKGFNVFRSQFVAKPAGTAYNVAFGRDAFSLAMRRLPSPLPGTGAITEYAEVGNFGMRVVMSYQPNTLAQQFTVDCLYGVGILRNSFGVQMQTSD